MSRLGAHVLADGVETVVWAPDAVTVDVELADRREPLACNDHGYWSARVAGIGHGDRYAFSLDGGPARPDPASGWQPDGVHGPSAVVDPSRFAWTDDEWTGRGLVGAVVYELHVGTFTPAGTLDAAIAELPRLAAVGVTTIELMPVNEFAGGRNWGYDGVLPYSVHHAYGGPEALARFVDAAHGHGLAVILDVVFNHFGPEGAYVPAYGPYLSHAYRTPWGPAINVAGPGSDGVRRFFAEAVARWVRDFHVDGFRFDAVHAIVDGTANPFWAEVCDAARRAAGRRSIALVAESSDNDPRQLAPVEQHGLGFDAVWCDDVHHNLRVATTGDRSGYYADYDGTPAELADTLAHRWKFRGQYSVARGRRHGRPVDHVAPHRFVVCSQNHDQVGNRPAGERPDHHVTAAQRRFLAAAVLLSPATPMLFQGEEYGERRPFPFFVDHTDPEILRATETGRRAEFASADWSGEVPAPGAATTFESAQLDPAAGDERLLDMYTELLRLRRERAPIASPHATQRVRLDGPAVLVERSLGDATTVVVLNESDEPVTLAIDGEIAFRSDDAHWASDAPVAADPADAIAIPAWTVMLLVRG